MKAPIWITLLALLVPSTLLAHADLDRRDALRAASIPWPEPPPAQMVRFAALGYRHFAADMLWLGAIQYYGAQRNRDDGHFRLLVPILEVVTALDPLFEYAYRFGGVAAVSPSGENMEAANRLLAAGQLRRPDRWRIPYIRASNCLLFGGSKKCMADGFAAAAEVAGAPDWLGLLASRSLADEDRESEAFELLTRLLDGTEDTLLRVRIEERLAQLKLKADRRALGAALGRWRRRAEAAGCPEDLGDLLDNQLTVLPAAPSGAPYRFGPDCAVLVSLPKGARR
jgi:hypothetical protein